MLLNFDISSGVTETTRLNSIYDVLSGLSNNTSKEISPRDVRNAFLSSWSNSIFKITTPDSFAGHPYIGIDTNNPAGKDFKSKILLGKRSSGSLDIMNSTLLSNDTDIFFYNTKIDTDPNVDSTKLSILAGSTPGNHIMAPYIESVKTGSVINLNISNPNGDINVNSLTGRISVNNVNFPTLSENTSDIADGKVLRYVGTYPNGKFEWVVPAVTETNIGSPGGTTNITGSPVKLNGHNLEFVEDTLVPKTIGGVNIGDDFESGSFGGDDWPMTEVIRKLLYPYVPAEFNISVNNFTLGVDSGVYVEVGVPSTIEISYDVTIFSYDVNYEIDYLGVIPVSGIETGSNNVASIATNAGGPPYFSNNPGSNITNNFPHTVNESTIGNVDFKLTVTEIGSGNPPYDKTASIQFVDPIYYGISNVDIDDPIEFTTFVSTADKLIKPYDSDNYYEVNYDGTGYLYFAYPNNSEFLTDLSEIKDHNGFVLHDIDLDSLALSSFDSSSLVRDTPGSPYQLNYTVYKTKLPTTLDGPSTFKFKF